MVDSAVQRYMGMPDNHQVGFGWRQQATQFIVAQQRDNAWSVIKAGRRMDAKHTNAVRQCQPQFKWQLLEPIPPATCKNMTLSPGEVCPHCEKQRHQLRISLCPLQCWARALTCDGVAIVIAS